MSGGEVERAGAGGLSARCETLLDNLDHAFVWEMDAQESISYVSARAENLLGYPRERWMREAAFWERCTDPLDRELLAETLRRALSEEKDQSCEHRFVSSNGQSIWFHTGVHPRRDGAGPFFWLVSMEITTLKRAEQELRDQLDFTRTVTGSLAEGVIAVDLAGRVTFCNRAAAKLLGSDEEAIIGKGFEEIAQVHHAGGAPLGPDEGPLIGALKGREAPALDDLSLQGPGRPSFPVSYTSAPIERGGQRFGAVLAFQDISERKQVQRALREDEHLRALGVLAGGIAHETNNPLTSVVASVELASRAVRSLQAKVDAAGLEVLGTAQAHLRRALDGSERIASVIRGVAAFARADNSYRGPLDVREALESAAELASGEIASRAKLQRVYGDVPAVVGNRSQLCRAFLNLLLNAAQSIPEGVPHEHAITVKTHRNPQGEVVIEVSDTGRGIAPEQQRRIFEPFFTTSAPGQGMGLGLSMVYRVVTEMGGRVTVDSSPGKGSTFGVHLPAHKTVRPTA